MSNNEEYIVRYNKLIKGNEIKHLELNRESDIEIIYSVYKGDKEIKAYFNKLKELLKEFDKKLVRNLLIKLTLRKLKESVSEDLKIINAISIVKELDVTINSLTERLREFYGIYFPEISDKENIEELVLENKEYLMKKYNISESVGGDFSEEDLKIVRNLAKIIIDMKKERKELLDYIETKLKKLLPNFTYLATTKIAAQFLEHAGSIEKLTKFPASTLQVIGAEKALFKHLVTGSKPPKHGIIYNHPLIKRLSKKNKGKAARALAAKLAIAVKYDYSHLNDDNKELIAEKFKDMLIKRFGVNWKDISLSEE